MFGRAYIEITNRCNRHCSFCPGTNRPPAEMSFTFFQSLLPQLLPLAKKIYFHVMGEPLLHPQFEDFVKAASIIGIPVEITTNGSLFTPQNIRALLNPGIRQINFSLHGMEAQNDSEVLPLFDFTRRALKERPELYLNYRFWNGNTNESNQLFLNRIGPEFGLQPEQLIPLPGRSAAPIKGRLSLHTQHRFEWPVNSTAPESPCGFCLGLQDQFAILAEGTLVPCCLDSDGNIPLGNCHDSSVSALLNAPAAQTLARAFKAGQILHPLCRKCSYRKRFDS